MLGTKIRKLDKETMKRAEEFKPNFENYNLIDGDNFNELWEKDKKFSQVRLTYHSHIDCDSYFEEKRFIILGFEEAKLLKKEVEFYKEQLERIQKEVALKNLSSEYEIDEYRTLSSPLRGDFGIEISVHKRCRPEEKAYEVEAEIQHKYEMENNKNYREKEKWFSEKHRPFRGAFSSWEDYYAHKGLIKG